jgi:hypothetical protein
LRIGDLVGLVQFCRHGGITGILIWAERDRSLGFLGNCGIGVVDSLVSEDLSRTDIGTRGVVMSSGGIEWVGIRRE